MKDTPENLTQYTFTAEQIAQADTAKLLAEDAVLSDYTKRLDELRAGGVNKISAVMQEIAAIRKNKLMSAEEKRSRIAGLQKQIADAKTVAAQHKDEDKELTHKAVQRVNALAAAFEQEVKKSEDAKAERHKQDYAAKVQSITEAAEKKKQDIAAAFAGKTSEEDRRELQQELTAAGNALKSALFDAKNHYETALGKCKTASGICRPGTEKYPSAQQ